MATNRDADSPCGGSAGEGEERHPDDFDADHDEGSLPNPQQPHGGLESTIDAKLLEVGRPLTPEIVQASLSGLGHTAECGVVYTCVTLSSLLLADVNCLAPYRHLQKILVDSNCLTTLQPLAQCNALVHLSAARNRLTEKVFEEIAGAWDSLQFLDVSANQVATLQGVSSFPFLSELLADNNRVTAIATGQLTKLHSLHTLSLVDNSIERIDDDAFAGVPVRRLRLDQNHINSLQPLVILKNTLSFLSVSVNNIMHFAPFVVHMKHLDTFDFSGNNAHDLGEIHALAEPPLLRTVSLLGNPLCTLGPRPNQDGEDRDDASDIVQDDAPSGSAAAAIAAAATPAVAAVAAVPSPTTKSGGGKAGAASNKEGKQPQRQQQQWQERPQKPLPLRRTAEELSRGMFSGKEDDIVALRPAEEDRIELLSKPMQAQYRLRVLWRAPGITVLDGVEVTPEELAAAQNLEGGMDRDRRSETRKKYLMATVAAAGRSV